MEKHNKYEDDNRCFPDKCKTEPSVPLVSAEEILKKYINKIGWLNNKDAVIAAMHEFRNQQPAVLDLNHAKCIGHEYVKSPLSSSTEHSYKCIRCGKIKPSPVVESKAVGMDLKDKDGIDAIVLLNMIKTKANFVAVNDNAAEAINIVWAIDKWLSESTPVTSSTDAGGATHAINAQVPSGSEMFTREQMEKCFYAARERVNESWFKYADPYDYFASLSTPPVSEGKEEKPNGTCKQSGCYNFVSGSSNYCIDHRF